MGRSSGDPLDLKVRVKGLVKDLVQRWPQESGYVEVPSGDCACLTTKGLTIVISSVRQQVFGIEVFTAFGIDPRDLDLVVVKSANHFRAAYDVIASKTIYMSSPGALTFDFASIPYRWLDMNKFPFVDDPWADACT
jgi:microcystin degradation protein MlrC